MSWKRRARWTANCSCEKGQWRGGGVLVARVGGEEGLKSKGGWMGWTGEGVAYRVEG